MTDFVKTGNDYLANLAVFRCAPQFRAWQELRMSLTSLLLLCSCSLVAIPGLADESYFPPRGDWEQRSARQLNIDRRQLQAAIRFAKDSENEGRRNLEENQSLGRGKEPFDRPVGPFRDRGDPTGLIIKDGYIVADWGDPARVDMTFSVTKSFLSSTVGLAFDDGLIRDLDDPVHEYFPPIVLPVGDGEEGREQDGVGSLNAIALFESDHNRKITWNHLLRQTSDWSGTLWGKPDWADRPGDDIAANRFRERNAPGTVYKYNDVRVNLLALATLQVWRRPLPQLLKERVMDPIGASSGWRWHGYENSWVTIDGLRVNSVSGGGHWGGGMHLSAFDQARFGLLLLRKGRWNDRQLLSKKWLELAETPGRVNPEYGFMNFFIDPSGPRDADGRHLSFSHLGAGVNLVHVDRSHDLVVVARWIRTEAIEEFLSKVKAALPKRG